jgi:hypothetical protein
MQMSHFGDRVAHSVVYSALSCLPAMQVRDWDPHAHRSLRSGEALETVSEEDDNLWVAVVECIGQTHYAQTRGLRHSYARVI